MRDSALRGTALWAKLPDDANDIVLTAARQLARPSLEYASRPVQKRQGGRSVNSKSVKLELANLVDGNMALGKVLLVLGGRFASARRNCQHIRAEITGAREKEATPRFSPPSSIEQLHPCLCKPSTFLGPRLPLEVHNKREGP
jgi:hypothetical protein